MTYVILIYFTLFKETKCIANVVRGRRYSSAVLESTRIRVLYRRFLYQESGTLMDNLGREANIIVTDVEAANGIIHAIDAVVLPYAP